MISSFIVLKFKALKALFNPEEYEEYAAEVQLLFWCIICISYYFFYVYLLDISSSYTIEKALLSQSVFSIAM